MSADEELVDYAAQVAGGPGAIFVGDLRRAGQLEGPAPESSLGGIDDEGKSDGSVPLESLERHNWIYGSPYYQDLLEKAKLTDPTPLTTKKLSQNLSCRWRRYQSRAQANCTRPM